MNAVTEQLDRQADERYRKAGVLNSNEECHDASVHNEARGAQIVQTNTLSTPVFVVLILALFLAATIAAIAIGLANTASYAAQIAEREARLAQERTDRLEVDVKVMLATQEKAHQ